METRTLAALLLLPAALSAVDGQKLFRDRCAACHGRDARGTGQGPGLAGNPRLSGQSVDQVRDVVQRGVPSAGMPAFDLPPEELDALAGYVRSLNAGVTVAPEAGRRVTWGKPEPGDWLTYNGKLTANRYSDLKQIHRGNVGGLRLKWIFPIPDYGLETTPLEAGGVMYVTGPNQVFAIDALTGNQIWKYSRPQTRGLEGDASLGTNRGVAIREDKVFYETDNAHLLALRRATGELVWEKTMPEEPQHYGGTMAPLVVGDTVIAGVAGADQGIRGFIACYKADTGELLWRHWTVPRKGEPGSETWQGSEPLRGPVLVDAAFRGKPRKLLLHADRNGFFYVLDRTNGELLLTTPFLRRVDWAAEIAPDGRPRVTAPKGCPDDAANWSSAAFSPATRLFYFLALEECTGSPLGYPDQTGQRFLRALAIETGKIVWEAPQPGAAKAKTWSGVLATAGGVVFYGKPNGGFEAVDERDGKMLWRFETNVRMKASPMTFEVAGKQYVAVAAGPNILCFGL
ncbi:Pyrrolo-quinoline quinone [Candidatus Sulfopaludibacter sp. SbA4]|nr:Pyrrolo-quinoline quinone [Candidatus Sulfopaludibacter sp. SbA4]